MQLTRLNHLGALTPGQVVPSASQGHRVVDLNAPGQGHGNLPEHYSHMLAAGPGAVASDAPPALLSKPYIDLPARIGIAPTVPMAAALTSTGGRTVQYNIPPSHHIPEEARRSLEGALGELTRYKSSAALLKSVGDAPDRRELMVTSSDLLARHGRTSAVVPRIKGDPNSPLALVLDIGLVRAADKTPLLLELHDLLVHTNFHLRGLPTESVLNTGRGQVLLKYELEVRRSKDAFRRELGLAGNEERTYALELMKTMKATGRWDAENQKFMAEISPELRPAFKD